MRNPLIDILRGLAILSVVLGHVIQLYMSDSCFENIVFKFIYSFHMPLFMLISGYLFSISQDKHTAKELMKRCYSSLLVPIIIYAIIATTLDMLSGSGLLNGGGRFGVVGGVFRLFKFHFIYKLWFLWALIFASVVTIFIRKLTKSVVVYSITWIPLFFIPDVYLYAPIKWLYFYFVLGLLVRYLFSNTKFINNKQLLLFLIPCVFLFFVSLHFYDINTYIYTSGYDLLRDSPLSQLCTDLKRTIIGVIGCISVIGVICVLIPYSSHIGILFANIGKYSIGIYAFHVCLLQVMSPIYFSPWLIINIIICFTIVSFLSCLYSIIVKKNRIANMLLLGGR